MARQRIAVIGGVAAGPAAAAEAKRTDPNADVVLFEQGTQISYGACELPYIVSGTIADADEVILLTPETFEETRGATVKVNHRVERIRPRRNRLVVRDVTTQAVREERFDKFILATGASADRALFSELLPRNVFCLRTLDDAVDLTAYLEAHTVRHAVVLGGGFVGLEAADALHQRGVRVSVLDGGRGLLGQSLNKAFQERLRSVLHAARIAVRSETAVDTHTGADGAVSALVTDKKEVIGCDLVVVATGIRPNVALAEQAGLKVGKTGALVVNDRMRTNIPNVWACGDCIEVVRTVDQRKIFYPLALAAFRTARVAGRNAARQGHGRPATFPGVIGIAAVKVFGYEIAQVGLTYAEAQAAGFDAHVTPIKHWSRVSMLPGAERLWVTLIWERVRGRVLGAQLMGREGAALRSNTLVPLIRSGDDLQALESLDFMYTPPLAPSLDPLFVAARTAIKQWKQVR